MTFGDKLFRLRKQKGFSQEALAEKLDTTRQAISKWENGQGFPETEKLLMMGNLFEVSIDYLLKDTVEQENEDKEGYYLSKEMAEGFLLNQRQISKYISLGMSLLILSTVPYLVFNQDPATYTPLIIIIAALGIVPIVSGITKEDTGYKVLKKEPLILDEKYLKELTVRYEEVKKKYAVVMGAGICLTAVGGLGFLLERKDIALGVLVPYYPLFVILIAVGIYILIRILPILDAYKLLVKNDEHLNRTGFKLLKKFRKKIDEL